MSVTNAMSYETANHQRHDQREHHAGQGVTEEQYGPRDDRENRDEKHSNHYPRLKIHLFLPPFVYSRWHHST
jgi:hypothetical protein